MESCCLNWKRKSNFLPAQDHLLRSRGSTSSCGDGRGVRVVAAPQGVTLSEGGASEG